MVQDNGGFEGGNAGWQLLDHPGVLLALGVFLLLSVTAGAVVVWIVARRIRRSPQVARGLLRLRAEALATGPSREFATLRLSLDRSVSYTAGCVAMAERSGRPVGELPGLVRRLVALAASLDQQLRLWEREPDPDQLRVLLTRARSRTSEVTESAERMRAVLGQLDDAGADAERTSLIADVAMEIEALQAGVASFQRRPHQQ